MAQIYASRQLRVRPEFGLGAVGLDQKISRGEHHKRGEKSLTALRSQNSVAVEEREPVALQGDLRLRYLICFSSLMVHGHVDSSFARAFDLNIWHPRRLGRIGLDERSLKRFQ